jgi:hypothetical protein
MRVIFTSNAWSQFNKLTREDQKRVLERLRGISAPPAPTAREARLRPAPTVTVPVSAVAVVRVRISSRMALVVSIQPLSKGEAPTEGEEP